MMRFATVLALLLNLRRVSCQQYQLIQDYTAANFFDEFSFFTGSDPTGGFVDYLPFETAASDGLIGNSSDVIYLGVDKTNVVSPNSTGRPSVRLQSKMTFTEGLFVIDLTHIPIACGAWPAFWTTGLGDWPADGEIDIIENVNDATTNNAALHATGDCAVTATAGQTSTWKSTDCNIVHDDNQGCGTNFTDPDNYGADFNANGGGVYAMEWTPSTVTIWFFPPTAVPFGLLDAEKTPDPLNFGTPSASFSGPCSDSFGDKFFNHTIVIDTDFCGGWAGGSFGSGSSSCPLIEGRSPQESCVQYVANNPQAFAEAYWGINSIRVWQKVAGFTPSGFFNQTNQTATHIVLPAPLTLPSEIPADVLAPALSPIPTPTDVLLESSPIPIATDVLSPVVSPPVPIATDIVAPILSPIPTPTEVLSPEEALVSSLVDLLELDQTPISTPTDLLGSGQMPIPTPIDILDLEQTAIPVTTALVRQDIPLSAPTDILLQQDTPISAFIDVEVADGIPISTPTDLAISEETPILIPTDILAPLSLPTPEEVPLTTLSDVSVSEATAEPIGSDILEPELSTVPTPSDVPMLEPTIEPTPSDVSVPESTIEPTATDALVSEPISELSPTDILLSEPSLEPSPTDTPVLDQTIQLTSTANLGLEGTVASTFINIVVAEETTEPTSVDVSPMTGGVLTIGPDDELNGTASTPTPVPIAPIPLDPGIGDGTVSDTLNSVLGAAESVAAEVVGPLASQAIPPGPTVPLLRALTTESSSPQFPPALSLPVPTKAILPLPIPMSSGINSVVPPNLLSSSIPSPPLPLPLSVPSQSVSCVCGTSGENPQGQLQALVSNHPVLAAPIAQPAIPNPIQPIAQPVIPNSIEPIAQPAIPNTVEPVAQPAVPNTVESIAPIIPVLPIPPVVTTVNTSPPRGSLFKVLDSATRNKLIGLFGSPSMTTPTTGGKLKRQAVAPGPAGDNSVTGLFDSIDSYLNDLPPVVAPLQSLAALDPSAPTKPQGPLIPALDQTDTSQAVSGLLRFLDDATKNQLVQGLAPVATDTSSTADTSITRRQLQAEPAVGLPGIDIAGAVGPYVEALPSVVAPLQSLAANDPSVPQPSAPLTAPLVQSDTSGALSLIFNFLDADSKSQLLNLILPPVDEIPTTNPVGIEPDVAETSTSGSLGAPAGILSNSTIVKRDGCADTSHVKKQRQPRSTLADFHDLMVDQQSQIIALLLNKNFEKHVELRARQDSDIGLPQPTESQPQLTDISLSQPTDSSPPLPMDGVLSLPTDGFTPLPTDSIIPLPTDNVLPLPTNIPLPMDSNSTQPTETNLLQPTESILLQPVESDLVQSIASILLQPTQTGLPQSIESIPPQTTESSQSQPTESSLPQPVENVVYAACPGIDGFLTFDYNQTLRTLDDSSVGTEAGVVAFVNELAVFVTKIQQCGRNVQEQTENLAMLNQLQKLQNAQSSPPGGRRRAQRDEPRWTTSILRQPSDRPAPNIATQIPTADSQQVSDITVPPGLSRILGLYGTLDPFGQLGPQTPSEAGTNRGEKDGETIDIPDSAEDKVNYTYNDLDESSVNDASPEIEKLPILDPFGQLGPRISDTVGEGDDASESQAATGSIIPTSKVLGVASPAWTTLPSASSSSVLKERPAHELKATHHLDDVILTFDPATGEYDNGPDVEDPIGTYLPETNGIPAHADENAKSWKGIDLDKKTGNRFIDAIKSTPAQLNEVWGGRQDE